MYVPACMPCLDMMCACRFWLSACLEDVSACHVWLCRLRLPAGLSNCRPDWLHVAVDFWFSLCLLLVPFSTCMHASMIVLPFACLSHCLPLHWPGFLCMIAITRSLSASMNVRLSACGNTESQSERLPAWIPARSSVCHFTCLPVPLLVRCVFRPAVLLEYYHTNLIIWTEDRKVSSYCICTVQYVVHNITHVGDRKTVICIIQSIF